FHTIDTQNRAVLGLVRENESETFIGLYNFGGERCTAYTGETGLYTDLVTGEAVDAGNVPLEPFGFRWLWKGTPTHPSLKSMQKIPARTNASSIRRGGDLLVQGTENLPFLLSSLQRTFDKEKTYPNPSS